MGESDTATKATALTLSRQIIDTVKEIQDSIEYSKGQLVKSYMGPEWRLSARYLLNEKSSLKFSFNTLRQYIHMLTNTTAISPTDVWKLSDTYIKPLTGQQLSVGYYTRVGKKEIELSVQ
jgi:hypothetical protein